MIDVIKSLRRGRMKKRVENANVQEVQLQLHKEI